MRTVEPEAKAAEELLPTVDQVVLAVAVVDVKPPVVLAEMDHTAAAVEAVATPMAAAEELGALEVREAHTAVAAVAADIPPPQVAALVEHSEETAVKRVQMGRLEFRYLIMPYKL